MPFATSEQRREWARMDRLAHPDKYAAWAKTYRDKYKAGVESRRRAREVCADKAALAWAINKVRRDIMKRDGLTTCPQCLSVMKKDQSRRGHSRPICTACRDKNSNSRRPVDKHCCVCRELLTTRNEIWALRGGKPRRKNHCTNCLRTRAEVQADRHKDLRNAVALGVRPCSKCKTTKPLSEFQVVGNAHHSSWCRACQRDYQKLIWRTRTKEQRAAIYQRTRAWERRDPARFILSSVRRLFACHLRRVVVGDAPRKPSATVYSWLGCDAAHFRAHIEQQFLKGMTWDNYGEWHIDHITSVAAGRKAGIEMPKLWHYKNLRPLWADDNRAKRDKPLNEPHQIPLVLL